MIADGLLESQSCGHRDELPRMRTYIQITADRRGVAGDSVTTVCDGVAIFLTLPLPEVWIT